jgi:hypothetical protein
MRQIFSLFLYSWHLEWLADEKSLPECLGRYAEALPADPDD